MIESDPEDDLKPEPTVVKQETSSGLVDMDTDISQLEAPTFTTLADRGPSQAMINLQWHHTANLIGKKVRIYQGATKTPFYFTQPQKSQFFINIQEKQDEQ